MTFLIKNIPVIFYVILMNLFLQACTGNNSTEQSNWPLYGRDYNNQRYSPLEQINRDNIKQLKLAWKYNTGKKATFQTTPIVVDGVMYITTPFNDVIALDAATGKIKWRYQHQLKQKNFCCGPANRGPAVAYGKVFTVTIDARVLYS